MMTLLMMTLVLFGFRCLMGQDYLRQIEEQRYNRKQIDFTPQLKAADLNTSLKDHKFLGGEYNDIWGFKDSGNQYVIISKTLGFAVYKINTNGTADLIVNEASANNENNIWGEVRYYNGYIYKSTEADSIRIYALNLADSTVTYMKRFNGDAHNITLYQNFLFACGGAKTGVACYDISDPLNPVFKWLYNTHYVHDMTIQDDVLYVAEGSNFTFALYDISSVIGSSLTEDYLILRHNYPGAYTHNIWPTPDGKYVVTTDEDNVPYHLQFWDISDPENILNLLKHREGNSSIVHNAFIKNDFIYASYYTKGLVIFDISDKRLPVKIASYDAYLPRDDGAFFGTWGVYPFMDSNYVALSTIETGLDIVEFDQSIRAGQLTVSFFDTLDIAYNDPVIVTVSDPKYVKYYQQGNQIRLKG
ncbi:MAG: choice-of-anchor B family protein, partial [Calditrichaeota bacterium]|nr:choice-of-anchor B family protein [Calditrichota bacterium]